MEAIILAGGKGTRLGTLTAAVPKPMLPIRGRPFLDYLFHALRLAGCSRVVLSVGYLAAGIEGHYGRTHDGMTLRYAAEEVPRGTGGAIVNAMQHCEEKQVFVLNGDSYAGADYAAMLQAHKHSGAEITLGIKRMSDCGRYGRVILEGGRIVQFGEKAHAGPGFINAGIYVISRDRFVTSQLPFTFSFEHDFLEPLAESAGIHAFEIAGEFIDIGTPESYRRASEVLPALD